MIGTRGLHFTRSISFVGCVWFTNNLFITGGSTTRVASASPTFGNSGGEGTTGLGCLFYRLVRLAENFFLLTKENTHTATQFLPNFLPDASFQIKQA